MKKLTFTLLITPTAVYSFLFPAMLSEEPNT